MFPYPYNRPALFAEQGAVLFVPCLIVRNLLLPELHVAFRLNVTGLAAVPETSVNKNGNSLCRKNKIWLAGQSFDVSAPASNFIFLEKMQKLLLGCLVASAAYRSHILGPRCFVVYVGHSLLLR